MKTIELLSTCVRCYYSIQVEDRSYTTTTAILKTASAEFPTNAAIKCSTNDDGHWVLYADRFHTPESLAACGSGKHAEYERANGDWSK